MTGVVKDENIGRLNVAVHNPTGMVIGSRLQKLPQNRTNHRKWKHLFSIERTSQSSHGGHSLLQITEFIHCNRIRTQSQTPSEGSYRTYPVP